mmetsp:Transcript_7037/g.11112  ORF Transcript_7037/g.11112 Transcript_7037/m.11112 type:complete len:149 (-) Transcript_7037:1161-1607(-)
MIVRFVDRQYLILLFRSPKLLQIPRTRTTAMRRPFYISLSSSLEGRDGDRKEKIRHIVPKGMCVPLAPLDPTANALLPMFRLLGMFPPPRRRLPLCEVLLGELTWRPGSNGDRVTPNKNLRRHVNAFERTTREQCADVFVFVEKFLYR